MSAREAILGRIHKRKGEGSPERADAVKNRLKTKPIGIIPASGQIDQKKRAKLFCTEAESNHATIKRVKNRNDVPSAVVSYLRSNNLPSSIRMGTDSRFARMGWKKKSQLEVLKGPSQGDDLACLSYAASAVAESGSLVLTSGEANPTTLNFLPEHHLVVIDVKDIEGDLETALGKIRKTSGELLPRNINVVTGPSKSGDIEQTIIYGAHGPMALHIILVG